MLARSLLLAGLCLADHAAGAAPERTYYTPKRIEVGLANLANYPWAADRLALLRRGQGYSYIVGRDYFSADALAELPDERLWLFQPTTVIPRVYPVESQAICPIHGAEVRKRNGYHPFIFDPIAHPYQLKCPIGGELYPSNRYDLGDLTSGDFPDDGDGFEHEGVTYYFLREYAHIAYGAGTIPGLRALSEGYLLTGDRKYAHAGSLLLARLASEYPNYTDRADRLYFAHYGGRSPSYSWKTGGMITDLIWETFCLEATAYAYDAFRPYFDDDPQLLAFCRDQGLPITDGDSLRSYIEDELFRPAAEALVKEDIKGNEGFHQAAALAVALVLDDYGDRRPNSQDLVDYAYFGAGHAAYYLINGLRTDGGGHESPNYNRIKADFIRVARLMEEVRARHPERYPLERYPDLFGTEKSRLLFDWFIDLHLQDAMIPSIGDCGGDGLVPRVVQPHSYSLLGAENLYPFQRTGDPRYGLACTKPDGSLVTGELWEPYPGDALQRLVAEHPEGIAREPRLLDGYGLGLLERGSREHRRAAVLSYATMLGHWQADPLLLELYGDGVRWLPDLGYPFSWQYRWTWDSNQFAHNTVTVDETQADRNVRHDGVCRLFAATDGVQVVTAAKEPYPRREEAGAPAGDVDLYERTIVAVDVDEVHHYTVDLFLVRGGTQHDQSWHGPQVVPEWPGLDWVDQPGTLAGPEVAQFDQWTDRWGRARDDFPSFLTGIRRATATEPVTARWDFGLERGETLSLHLVPVDGPLELIAGHGRSPARPAEWRLDYLLARRTGDQGLASRFLTVIDTALGEPTVKAVRLVANDPITLEVDHLAGTDRLMLDLPVGPARGSVARPLGVTVARSDGRTVTIGGAAGYRNGRIVDVDWERNRIAVEAAEGIEPGRYVRVWNDATSAMYRIDAVEPAGDRVWLDLNQSALLARAPVESVGDGWLELDAYLQYGELRADAGQPVSDPATHPYHGATLAGGGASYPVLGVERGEVSRAWLATPIPAAELAPRVGEVVSVWQYGVDDRFELAGVATTR